MMVDENVQPGSFGRRQKNAPEIIVGTSYWVLNGVNVFSANLVRGLRSQGISSHILLTEERSHLVKVNEARMSRPSDLPFVELPLSPRASWGAHWGALIRYLEERAPCLYIPNSDYRHSCVGPLLSDRVGIMGVVHSDDPLHYDHVFRQGKYWNAIAAVSKNVAEKVMAQDPGLSARMTVIPIGVDIPFSLPKRNGSPGKPLKLIYHGTLKQHQKRVLDLPKVMAEVTRLKVPVELTIAGGGPDDHQLRKACEEFVARGVVRFLGVVPHEEILRLLETQDVSILTSEFEGMPNALLEAMGRGCVPLVTQMESGVPELVQDGVNGCVVPIGDIQAFAKCLKRLHQEQDERRSLSLKAYETVSAGNFRTQDMVQAYVRMADHVLDEMNNGKYKRPPGILQPPPPHVGGVDIFPIPLTHKEDGLGLFPTRSRDFRQFKKQVGQLKDPLHRALRQTVNRGGHTEHLNDVRVVVGSPTWTYTGVNEFSANLVRGLLNKGVSAHILLTEEKTNLVDIRAARMPHPTDIPFEYLSVDRSESWGGHWGAMIRYLEEQAPCIYFPNYDWRHSCVSPLLSNRVAIVGVVHQDDPLYLDHVERLGRYWNAIVPVNSSTAQKIQGLDPAFTSRMTIIPYGLSVPSAPPDRPITRGAPLQVVCQSWFTDPEVKMLRDLLRHLTRRQIPVEFTLVSMEGQITENVLGDLVEHPKIRILNRIPQNEMWEVYSQSDVFFLLSVFEDMENVISEAMGRGCVPIVAQTAQTDDLICDGSTGFRVPYGDIEGFVNRITLLQQNVDRRRDMAHEAHDLVSEWTYRTEDMVEDYLEVFDRVRDEMSNGTFQRPQGILCPPPTEVAGTPVFSVELNHEQGDLGLFPSQTPDFQAFQTQLEQIPVHHHTHLAPPVARLIQRYLAMASRLKDMPVIVGMPSWSNTGIGMVAANLVRELTQRGIPAQILLTEEQTDLIDMPETSFPRPFDIAFEQLPVGRAESWGAHWGAMLRYLEERAPCIYLPTYDWRHSCVSPLLSNRVAVVGMMCEDDPLHRDHVERLGRYWNAIVAWSEPIAQTIQDLDPTVASRMVTISHDFNLPGSLMVKDYLEVFDRVRDEMSNGAFQRPQGILRPPPAEVAGINIFPILVSYREKGIGLFPFKEPDYLQFNSHALLR